MMRYFDLQMVKRINGKRQSSIHLSLSSNFHYTVQKSNSYTLSSKWGGETSITALYTISNKNDGYDALF